MASVWLTGCHVGAVRQADATAAPPAEPIRIDAMSVPLNRDDLSQLAVGDFRYAGGLVLTSLDTDRLHGLSDLEVYDADRLTAVGDEGTLLEARLVLDETGRLVGLADARLTPLTGADGQPLSAKVDSDAEGLARLPTGDRLVSFERRHRIWLYPAAGGPPHAVPAPEAEFPANGGLEALSADAETAPDAYVAGAETSGDTWTCRLSSAQCTKGPTIDKPPEFGLVALRRLPTNLTAYLLRAFDEIHGSRISLQVVRGGQVVARMDLSAPLTVDNYEGLSAVPRADGGYRFYLLSDDNGSDRQRTLLLAFDLQI